MESEEWLQSNFFELSIINSNPLSIINITNLYSYVNLHPVSIPRFPPSYFRSPTFEKIVADWDLQMNSCSRLPASETKSKTQRKWSWISLQDFPQNSQSWAQQKAWNTLHSKTWSTERPVMTNIFLHFFNHCWTSQMWFLYALSNRNACNTREAEFIRKSVKDDYPDSPLTCFSPVLKRLCC